VTAPRSARDLLWDACRRKTCCHTTRVVLTGHDLARLVRAFELEPDAFALAIPVPAADADAGAPGFLLEPAGAQHELVLRKRGELGPAGAPCVFLVQTNDGHASCGAGDVRPAVCAAFPAALVAGRLRVAGACCDCRVWSVLDLGPRERARAAAAAAEEEQHAAAVRAWNAEVRATGAARSLADVCRHLIGACG
jgi:Fe-S-cluster containining protein